MMEANGKTERPRLVARHVAQGQVAQQALAVADASCEGVVDEVLVDFRHPDLPPGEWEARPWWYVGDTDDNYCGFLFPTEAAALDRGEWGKLRDENDELIQRKLGLPRAIPSDRLAVESVVDRINDRRFDHRHDATVKLAYLALERADGEVIRPPSPLAFYGVTQLRDAPQRDAYDRLAERILAEHGNPNPHTYDIRRRLDWPFPPPEGYSLTERAALAIERAESAWLKLKTTHLRDDPMGQAALRSALSNAVLAAFYQAKHESTPAEQRAAVQIENLAEGPRTRKDWDRIGCARSLAEAHSDWTRNRLATGVIEELGLNEKVRRSIQRMLARENIGPPPV